MTWTLTITGDCQEAGHGSACLVIPIRDWTHSHKEAVSVVEQLACEEFHDTYPQHCICEITWTREAVTSSPPLEHDCDYDYDDECRQCGALADGYDE